MFAIRKSQRHSYHALGAYKPTERLIELKDIVRILIIFKARRLLNIDFFDWPVEEHTFHVHLVKLEIMLSSID